MARNQQSQARVQDDSQASSETTQRAIAGIWEEVLEQKGVGTKDDFFDLGGTSLGLIRVFDQLNEKFDLSLDGSVLEEEATIAYLTERVEAELHGA